MNQWYEKVPDFFTEPDTAPERGTTYNINPGITVWATFMPDAFNRQRAITSGSGTATLNSFDNPGGIGQFTAQSDIGVTRGKNKSDTIVAGNSFAAPLAGATKK